MTLLAPVLPTPLCPSRGLPDELLQELPDYEEVMEGLADDGSPSVYYHTDSTRELSATVGDVLYKIQDMEVHQGAGLQGPHSRLIPMACCATL